ncbi:hypothetical protein TNCV_4075681 [Trichonephila clavipes]|nr:hypothetical protein TNCV_4075681 [Trichonephila clavipes]
MDLIGGMVPSCRYTGFVLLFYIGEKEVNGFLWQLVPLVKHRLIRPWREVAIGLLRAFQAYSMEMRSGGSIHPANFRSVQKQCGDLFISRESAWFSSLAGDGGRGNRWQEPMG